MAACMLNLTDLCTEIQNQHNNLFYCTCCKQEYLPSTALAIFILRNKVLNLKHGDIKIFVPSSVYYEICFPIT